MQIKFLAMLNTAKVFTICTLVAFGVSAIFHYIPTEYIATGFAVLALGIGIRLCYDNEKAKLEALDRLNNIK